MKSLVVAFGAAFLLILFPAIFGRLIDAQTDDYTQNFAGVSTGAGEYSANFTLSQDLFEDNTVSVSSISSNISGDSPSASAYNSVSRVLTAGGLQESQTRTISVTYDIEDPSLPAGVVVFLQIFIWFFMLIDLGLLVGSVYAFFES